MPNRKQIIIISVLCVLALLLGYWTGPFEGTGKQAEVRGPIAPTIITNVITNTVNNIVTNIITNTVPSKAKANPAKPKPTPTRQLTLEEKKLIGTYESEGGEVTYIYDFLDNGIVKSYVNDQKILEHKWSIVDNELHIGEGNSYVNIYRINPDNSLTKIAALYKGKRTDLSKEFQYTYKKINQLQPTRNLTLKEKNIVGTYEWKKGTTTYGYVFLANGTMEWVLNGRQIKYYKWSIVGNELYLQATEDVDFQTVWRINQDNSFTSIALIQGGRRTDYSKVAQVTFKKIK